jgi:hypothetical protein
MIAAAMAMRFRVERFIWGQCGVDVVGSQRKSLKKFRNGGKGPDSLGEMRYLDGVKIDSLPDSLRPDSLPEWECQRKSGKGHVASTLPEWNGTLSQTN